MDEDVTEYQNKGDDTAMLEGASSRDQRIPSTPPWRATQHIEGRRKQEVPNEAVTTRKSSSPNRFDEYESNIRPVLKRQAILRYEEEYPNMTREDLNEDDGYESSYCFNNEKDG